MRKESFDFLSELVAAPSPSGYEQPAQRVFRKYIEPFAQVEQDMLGNVIGRLGSGDSALPRVMLIGHSDEIGFQVKYIDDKGFIYFGAIGGVDPHLTPGQRIVIHGRNGRVHGVIGRKPIHLIEAKERETVTKLDSQYIDIGVGSQQEVAEFVRVGDPITFAVNLQALQGDRVTSRGFDDKAGSFVVAEVLREIAQRESKPALELFGVSSVQEEVGLRGGTTSAYNIRPDVGICVEVDFCTDQPDVEKKHNGEVKLGHGPILPRGANINPALFELLAETAAQENIPVQFTGIPRATGTDANVMQISRGGVATALVKIPLRYMHTPVEVLSLGDLQHAIRLISAALYKIRERRMFIPG